MTFPEPRPGLVVRYAYLWRSEAARGREDRSKDRPCVVVLAVRAQGRELVVTVVPITHSPPAAAVRAVELPAATKRRLRLDGARSWIVTDDLNRIVWPGPDLRPVPIQTETFAYGLLPASLYEQVRLAVLAYAREGRARVTGRMT